MLRLRLAFSLTEARVPRLVTSLMSGAVAVVRYFIFTAAVKTYANESSWVLSFT